MIPSAVVLIAHGSPDPDWRRPIERLEQRLARELGRDRVAVAYLTHAPSLADAIATLVAGGQKRVEVIAALLSPGGLHVKRDIPAEVAKVREGFEGVEIVLREGALGDDEGVIEALAVAVLRG